MDWLPMPVPAMCTATGSSRTAHRGTQETRKCPKATLDHRRLLAQEHCGNNSQGPAAVREHRQPMFAASRNQDSYHLMGVYLWQQTVVFLLDHGVALTTAILKTDTVEHVDVPSRVANQPGLL